MRIALIEPERTDSERVTPEARARWASAEALVGMGHDVRVVTGSSHAHPTMVIRGRLSEHAMARPPLVRSQERVAHVFAASSAKRVWEWHEADEIDVVEAPAGVADEIALVTRASGGGPPLVVSIGDDDGEPTLGRALADDVIPAFSSPGDRLAAYAAAVARRWAAERGSEARRSAALRAWRVAQTTLAETAEAGGEA